MDNEKLRTQVRVLKALKNISFKTIAEETEIKYNTFLNWLSNQFDFSFAKLKKIKDFIEKSQEE